ncbi:MAG: AEC family transporter [Oscillospiraceae bacterium]|nr:AEC family transporter [Oscillospiraceae bacterium]
MDITVAIHSMLVLFLLLAVGYGARKCKVFDGDSDTLLTRLLLNITIPALLITAVMGGPTDLPRSYLFYFMLVSLLAFVIKGALGFLSAVVLRIPRTDRGTVTAMIMFGNVGFMGLPIVNALFGPEGLFIAVLLNVVFNFLVFSLAIKLVAGGGAAKVTFRQFLNAPMLSSLLAFILILLGARLPEMLYVAMDHLGGMTTPLAMLLLGSTLAAMPVREIFQDWRVYIIVGIKLLLVPLAVYLVLIQFVTDPMLLSVVVVLSAMPVATSLPMLCIQYGGNHALVGRGIFISTVLAMVTIPLLTPLFQL